MDDSVGGSGLTDDQLTQLPSRRTPRAYLQDAVDGIAGADPGLSQLRLALQAVLGISVALVLVEVFVRVTGALQLAPGAAPPAAVASVNHALLIVSMLLAGMVAMMAGFTVQDATVRGQLVSSALLPVPMLGAITLGLLVGGHRVLSLVFLVVVMAVAVYVRRWPPRGFAWGMVGFNGAFLGFFLHAELALRDVGWLACDLVIGIVASLLVRFAFFRPDAARTLARMRRSWIARKRRLLSLSVETLDVTDARGAERSRDRLRRQVVRLNESTLMIDAQLAAARPDTAAVEAHRLFDLELAISNCARFAAALAVIGAPTDVRARAADTLRALLTDDVDATASASERLRRVPTPDTRTAVLTSRLAASADDAARARARMDTPVSPAERAAAGDGFDPAVQLFNGFLPGSMPVSAEASTTRGRGGRLDRAALPPYLRTTIQVVVAGTLAVVVGDAVSGPRLYWAVLAVFLCFIAATNSGEQVRRALFRASGTAIGIVVGDLLVHLTGGHLWISIAIVLVALFFGIYLIRINYMFMTLGITVTMSQLYVQLHEFSWSLLVLRLGETAIGVAAVIVTVLLIVPLRPQRVLTTAVLQWFTALRTLVEAVLDRLDGVADDARPALLPLVRGVDAAYAALEATAAPLRKGTFGRNSVQLVELLSVAAAARQYVRSLSAELQDADRQGVPPLTLTLHDAAEQLHASLDAIEHRIRTGERGCFTRSAGLLALTVDDVGRERAPLRSALRDLTLLDGTLARLAQALDMDVRDHDTSPPDSGAVGRDLVSRQG
ncbi:MAG: FUSC family protein [Jatrophihabitans sp.]|uniref:FUSC family protein n=1 Tax=Jatrophihabitans sp. TaxID=1932789 RepID=UPI003F7E92D3